MNATRELQQALARRRELMQRVRDSRDSLVGAVNSTPLGQPQAGAEPEPSDQRDSAR